VLVALNNPSVKVVVKRYFDMFPLLSFGKQNKEDYQKKWLRNYGICKNFKLDTFYKKFLKNTCKNCIIIF
jgi:hypothetical protein